MPMSRTTWIDSDYTDESVNPKVVNGVKMGEGDGTVSLLSLGAMCVEGWQRKRWNPSEIPVTTVEVNKTVFSISWVLDSFYLIVTPPSFANYSSWRRDDGRSRRYPWLNSSQ